MTIFELNNGFQGHMHLPNDGIAHSDGRFCSAFRNETALHLSTPRLFLASILAILKCNCVMAFGLWLSVSSRSSNTMKRQMFLLIFQK